MADDVRQVDRHKLIADQIDHRQKLILEAVPPRWPDAQWWLMSDAGPSFCYECVIKARAKEFGLGIAPLNDPGIFHYGQSDLEEAFWTGIDSVGTYHCCESAAYCETCGEMLSYFWDNDECVEEEMRLWRENPITKVNPYSTYELHQLLINVGWHSSRRQLVSACSILKQFEAALSAAAKVLEG